MNRVDIKNCLSRKQIIDPVIDFKEMYNLSCRAKIYANLAHYNVTFCINVSMSHYKTSMSNFMLYLILLCIVQNVSPYIHRYTQYDLYC